MPPKNKKGVRREDGSAAVLPLFSLGCGKFGISFDEKCKKTVCLNEAMQKEKQLQVLRLEIEKLKAKGVKTVDVVDIYRATHLPVTRITQLMHRLEHEGIVVSDE